MFPVFLQVISVWDLIGRIQDTSKPCNNPSSYDLNSISASFETLRPIQSESHVIVWRHLVVDIGNCNTVTWLRHVKSSPLIGRPVWIRSHDNLLSPLHSGADEFPLCFCFCFNNLMSTVCFCCCCQKRTDVSALVLEILTYLDANDR